LLVPLAHCVAVAALRSALASAAWARCIPDVKSAAKDDVAVVDSAVMVVTASVPVLPRFSRLPILDTPALARLNPEALSNAVLASALKPPEPTPPVPTTATAWNVPLPT